MPLLGSCCCFDLRVGTKIIAIFYLVISIFSFVINGLSLIVMVLLGDNVREALKQEQARNDMLSAIPPRDTRYRDTTNNFPRNREYNERFDEDYYDEIYSDLSRKQMNNMLELISEHLHIVKIVLLVAIIIMALNIICSSCLIHGVKNHRRGLFMPWLTLQWIGVVIDFVWIIAVIVGGIYLELPVAVYVCAAIGGLICWGVVVYLILVVTSQYQAMGLIILREEEMSMK